MAEGVLCMDCGEMEHPSKTHDEVRPLNTLPLSGDSSLTALALLYLTSESGMKPVAAAWLIQDIIAATQGGEGKA